MVCYWKVTHGSMQSTILQKKNMKSDLDVSSNPSKQSMIVHDIVILKWHSLFILRKMVNEEFYLKGGFSSPA